jgi:hypothetical protein
MIMVALLKSEKSHFDFDDDRKKRPSQKSAKMSGADGAPFTSTTAIND